MIEVKDVFVPLLLQTNHPVCMLCEMCSLHWHLLCVHIVFKKLVYSYSLAVLLVEGHVQVLFHLKLSALDLVGSHFIRFYPEALFELMWQ